MKYYLAGPMRGYPGHNFPAFTVATMRLRARGYEIITPVEINPEAEAFAGQDNYGFDFLRRDLAIIAAEADAIILLRGWSKSHGAWAELSLAHAVELPVYVWLSDTGQLLNIS